MSENSFEKDEDYLEKATDSRQYDSQSLEWEVEGLSTSPTRRLYQEHLQEVLDVKGKSVVDIGSGMGQLFPLLQELGASEITGIEPSEKSCATSRKLYPDISVLNTTLQEMPTDRKYDAAILLFILEHIKDLDASFKKIRDLLTEHGMLYAALWDKEYALTPRFDYLVDSQVIDEETTAVKTQRPYGVMYDLVRPIETSIASAEQAGFQLVQHKKVKPTESYISLDPKYNSFRGKTIAHLLNLQKQ